MIETFFLKTFPGYLSNDQFVWLNYIKTNIAGHCRGANATSPGKEAADDSWSPY